MQSMGRIQDAMGGTMQPFWLESFSRVMYITWASCPRVPEVQLDGGIGAPGYAAGCVCVRSHSQLATMLGAEEDIQSKRSRAWIASSLVKRKEGNEAVPKTTRTTRGLTSAEGPTFNIGGDGSVVEQHSIYMWPGERKHGMHKGPEIYDGIRAVEIQPGMLYKHGRLGSY